MTGSEGHAKWGGRTRTVGLPIAEFRQRPALSFLTIASPVGKMVFSRISLDHFFLLSA